MVKVKYSVCVNAKEFKTKSIKIRSDFELRLLRYCKCSASKLALSIVEDKAGPAAATRQLIPSALTVDGQEDITHG